MILRPKTLDMQCRSMRDILIFYRIPEERNETDDDCVEKVLTLIEQQLEIQNAKDKVTPYWQIQSIKISSDRGVICFLSRP